MYVMLQTGSHHVLEDFGRRGEEPKEEVQIYTWEDATLRCNTFTVTGLICHFPSF